MLVLALDTSTPAVTAGVVLVLQPHQAIEAMQAGTPATSVSVLAEHRVLNPFGHAEHLMPLARAAVTEAGATFADLDAVVVGLGPGPFTGLRVGIATAEALGDALGRPVYGVPSHDGVASSTAATGPFLVATDARRREIYVSAFDAAAHRTFGPAVTAPADLPGRLARISPAPAAVTGAGADLAGLDLPRLAIGSAAGGLAAVAARDLVTGAVPGPLTPLYLRRADVTEPAGPKPVLT